MTKIDNSKIFLGGIFTDAEVTVPAKTTYVTGTVLGRNSNGKLVGFSTDNNVAASEGVEAFTADPLYILAQTLTNESNSAETVELVRVYDGGAVDKNKLVFVKAADADNVEVLDAMKRNHFRLEDVQQLSE